MSVTRFLSPFMLSIFVAMPALGVEPSIDGQKVATVEDAVSQVLKNNPRLKALSDKANGLRALVEQASYIPNPELELEAENFGGSLEGFRKSENTLALSQTIETGGKRTARVKMAEAEHELFQKEMSAELNEVIGNLKIAFAEVQRRETLHILASEELKLANETVSDVRKRVEHGAILSAELSKAELDQQGAELRYQRSELALQTAKRRLASFWGGETYQIGKVGRLPDATDSIPELAQSDCDQGPLIDVADGKIEFAKRSLAHQESLKVPDLTVNAGYRRFEDTNDHAFVGGISVPLPIFNRNKGSIQSAASSIGAERKLRANLKNKVCTQTENLRRELKLQVSQLAALKKKLLPTAEKTYRHFQEAFNMGRSSYLELLDAQRGYLETRREAVEVNFSAVETQAELQVLLGSAVDMVNGEFLKEHRNEK